mmetsp:Transcript_47100/g.134874  ORF Transcript_47100/g.134874 Transcript_47100/m.134874 type:complete len:281 (+) Transcript_47100:816-1658(+)
MVTLQLALRWWYPRSAPPGGTPGAGLGLLPGRGGWRAAGAAALQRPGVPRGLQCDVPWRSGGPGPLGRRQRLRRPAGCGLFQEVGAGARTKVPAGRNRFESRCRDFRGRSSHRLWFGGRPQGARGQAEQRHEVDAGREHAEQRPRPSQHRPRGQPQGSGAHRAGAHRRPRVGSLLGRPGLRTHPRPRHAAALRRGRSGQGGHDAVRAPLLTARARECHLRAQLCRARAESYRGGRFRLAANVLLGRGPLNEPPFDGARGARRDAPRCAVRGLAPERRRGP